MFTVEGIHCFQYIQICFDHLRIGKIPNQDLHNAAPVDYLIIAQHNFITPRHNGWRIFTGKNNLKIWW